jgi:hypothetical protein
MTSLLLCSSRFRRNQLPVSNAGQEANCLSTDGFTILPFAFLRSFTSTQDQRTQPARNIAVTIAARYRSTGDVKVLPACAYDGLNRNCRMRSILGRSGIVLARPALLGAIQAPALLDMA